jgi:hypothetical protein
MRYLKTGKHLWDHIEDKARKKHKVGEEFKLTMVDLRFPPGECEYRLNNDKRDKYYRGILTYKPYEEGEVNS